MKQYQPVIPMMSILISPDELIALGNVINEFVDQSERIPNKSRELLELLALLRCFQGRVVTYSHKLSQRGHM